MAAGVFFNVLHERLPPIQFDAKFDIALPENGEQKWEYIEKESYRKRLLDIVNVGRFVPADQPLEKEAASKALALAKKVVEKVMDVAQYISSDLRVKLFNVIDNITDDAEMEKLYGLFMKELDSQDWYTMSKALRNPVNEAAGESDKALSFKDFYSRFIQFKGRNLSEHATDKTE